MATDIVDTATRSRMMAGIKGKDTRPELVVRRGLHALGFRYRLHDRRLPGRPDIVLHRHRAVIFVNGCFWHGHDCPLFRWPKTREAFWREKITRNRERDGLAEAMLDNAGWRVLRIWECSIKGAGQLGPDTVLQIAVKWLGSDATAGEIEGAGRADR